MTLPVPYIVQGQVTDNGSPVNGATVYAEGTLGTGSDTTDASGYYHIDLQDYADDGDEITVSCTYDGKTDSDTFTLFVGHGFKEISLTLQEYLLARYNGDLLIYYGDMGDNDFVDGWCTRWDHNDWGFTVESIFTKEEINTLLNNVLPGAVGILTDILGEKVHYDKTWEGNNTIKVKPNKYTRKEVDGYKGSINSNLVNMREETYAYVKDIVTNPIEGADGWVNIKLECIKSGSIA